MSLRGAADHPGNLLGRAGRAQIEHLQAVAKITHVDVRIDEPGDDRRALGVDATGGRTEVSLDAIAHGEPLSCLHRHGGRHRLLRVQRVDSRVRDGQIGGLRAH